VKENSNKKFACTSSHVTCAESRFMKNNKIQTKNSHVHLHMFFHVHKVVSQKTDMSFVLQKKTNFGGKKRHFMVFILSFLHRPSKMLFFHKTLRTHMDYGDVRVNFFIQIFGHLEICFF
jgi:hypothetical protein